jgi:hypothetical protein
MMFDTNGRDFLGPGKIPWPFFTDKQKGLRKGRILDQLSTQIMHFTTEDTEKNNLCALCDLCGFLNAILGFKSYG